MKKAILVTVAMSFGIAGWAQKSAIQSANNYLRDKELDQAKEYIDQAVVNVSTQNDPKAWFVRGNVYAAMQEDPKYKASNPYKEAVKSYLKVIEIKPDYEKAAVNQNLYVYSYRYFNEGINSYNNKQYDDAITNLKQVVAIDAMNEGTRFAEYKQLDTIATDANYIIGNAYYLSERYDEAIPYYANVKNSKLVSRPDVYLRLADIYTKKNEKDQALAAIQAGRAAYPNDPSIRNAELNAFIASGKQEELVKKLEDAVAQEPNNPELFYNLATTYQQMAEPTDNTGKFLPKPANSEELLKKAEVAYTKALQLKSDDAGINYNLGALYYNQAIELNSKMNDIPGTSPAEMKKYDELKAKRDALYTKALPSLEKTFHVLDPKVASLSTEDKVTYRSTLISLKEIYAKQNQMDKMNQMATKLKEMK